MGKVGQQGRLYLTSRIWVPQTPLHKFNLRLAAWLRRALPDLPLTGNAALSVYPQLSILQQRHTAIRGELMDLLAENDRIPTLVDLHPRDKRISSDHWKNYVLKLWGYEINANTRRCLQTRAVIESIPGVHTALFSILEPHAYIPPHKGWAAGVVRCHYPLITPPLREKCFIEVEGGRHSWQEREPFLFDDTQRHSVRNDTDATRVVLIIDFEPPFDMARKLYSRFRYHVVRRTKEIREICKRAPVADRHASAETPRVSYGAS